VNFDVILYRANEGSSRSVSSDWLSWPRDRLPLRGHDARHGGRHRKSQLPVVQARCSAGSRSCWGSRCRCRIALRDAAGSRREEANAIGTAISAPASSRRRRGDRRLAADYLECAAAILPTGTPCASKAHGGKPSSCRSGSGNGLAASRHRIRAPSRAASAQALNESSISRPHGWPRARNRVPVTVDPLGRHRRMIGMGAMSYGYGWNHRHVFSVLSLALASRWSDGDRRSRSAGSEASSGSAREA